MTSSTQNGCARNVAHDRGSLRSSREESKGRMEKFLAKTLSAIRKAKVISSNYFISFHRHFKISRIFLDYFEAIFFHKHQNVHALGEKEADWLHKHKGVLAQLVPSWALVYL